MMGRGVGVICLTHQICHTHPAQRGGKGATLRGEVVTVTTRLHSLQTVTPTPALTKSLLVPIPRLPPLLHLLFLSPTSKLPSPTLSSPTPTRRQRRRKWPLSRNMETLTNFRHQTSRCLVRGHAPSQQRPRPLVAPGTSCLMNRTQVWGGGCHGNTGVVLGVVWCPPSEQ